MKETILLTALAVLLSIGGACDTGIAKTSDSAKAEATEPATQEGASAETETGEAETGAKKAEIRYSPFGVRLQSGDHFHLISFKDVGLTHSGPTQSNVLLETIAQSLALQLQSERSLDVRPRVIYDESLADPDEHTYCGAHQLYVDVWRSSSPDRWGYSLWSGCSETHNFAWNEIPVTDDTDSPDDVVTPLTEGITQSLAEATAKGCFERSC